MELSIIILFVLILVFGVVASRAVVKRYKKSNKEDFRFKNL